MRLSQIKHELLSASVLESLSINNVLTASAFLAHNPGALSTRCPLSVQEIFKLRNYLKIKYGICSNRSIIPKSRTLPCEVFNELKTEYLYEFYGGVGSGKTQTSMFLSASLIKKDRRVLYIDTKNDFSMVRMKNYLNKFMQKAMNFKIAKCFDLHEALKITNGLIEKHEIFGIDLLVLDNIASLVLPLLEDDNIGDTFQQVAKLVINLKKIAFNQSCAVLVINSATNLGTRPSLGKIFGNAANVRYSFRKIGPQKSQVTCEKTTSQSSMEDKNPFVIEINEFEICKQTVDSAHQLPNKK